MPHRLAAIAMLLAVASPAQAADPIAGRWITEGKDAIVSVGSCGKTVCGRIAKFLVKPPQGGNQRDVNNPNKALQKRKLLGLPILTGFRKDGKVWRGKIYDPNTGKTYRSILRRKSANVLEVKGCLGPFCQTQIWRKAR